MKLSVVLATRNEGINLAKCLESVRQLADEIVIADEKSFDDTVEIAKKYGARVISVPHNENFHITKNIAIDAATGDWVLQLDADEVVSSELAREISYIIHHKSLINGYWINRKNWFLDRFLTKGGQYPDPTLRLYKRGFGKLPAKSVHEQATVQGKTDHLKHDLLHYRDLTFKKYLQGFDRYSSFNALQMKEKSFPINPKSYILYLFIKPIATFLSIYVRHRGYVDGFPGFIFAFFSGLIHPTSFIKYLKSKGHHD